MAVMFLQDTTHNTQVHQSPQRRGRIILLYPPKFGD